MVRAMRLIGRAIAGALVAALLVVPSPARAADTPGWIGGTASISIPNFTFPDPAGCFYVPVTGGVTTATTDTRWTLKIDFFTSTGAVAMMGLYEYGTGNGTITDRIMVCYSLDGPGTYTYSGQAKFERTPDPWRDSIPKYEYTLPLSGTFTVSDAPSTVIAPPAPAPAPPAAGPSQACIKAKAKLEKVKKRYKRGDATAKALKKAKKNARVRCK